MAKNSVIVNRTFLRNLIKVAPSSRKKIISKATGDEIRAIRESVLNVANKNVPVSPKVLKKLQRYRKVLRKLAYQKQSEKTTKRLINQHGGFLPALIPAVLAFVASKLVNG